MAYTVFARKYRPQTFDELVGQEHVARTLANAITSDRVAHAFLFTGVRGVGKTTTARLLAKALNCEKGPTPTPDNTCAVCTEITAGVDMDVLEMDGASNNSVEDVRRLQESIPYRPTRDRYKVIIVDEVHMLSTAAFNAFLKTLEEPPPHVKFVFATTEAHKVPVTIRSRCQRYDFRLIPQKTIADAVRGILAKEAVDADDTTIGIVAREAAGSMRDALTLLDQLVAAGGDVLRGDQVASILGIADREAVHEAMRAMVAGDAASVLRAIDGVASRGTDLVHLARQLLELARDLVVLRVAGDDETLVGLVDDERHRAEALSGSVSPLELQRLFAGLSPLVDEVSQSSAPRTVLEMGLVRLALRPPLEPVGELLSRLDALERRLGGGGGGGGAGGRRGGPPPGRGDRRGGGARAGAPAGPEHDAPPARGAGARPEPSRPLPSAVDGPAPAPRRAAAPAPLPEPPAEPGPPRSRADDRSPRGEPAPPTRTAAPEPRVSGPVAAPARGAAADVPAMARWERIVARVGESHPALGAVLERGVPLTVEPEKVEVGFPRGSFFGHQADSRDAQGTLAAAAAAVLGGAPAVKITWMDADGAGDRAPAARTVAEVEAERRREREEATRKRALDHPAVRAAMEVFPEAASHVAVHVEGD